MKILIATGIFPPQIGGSASHLFRLSNELIKKNIKVEVVTYGEAVQSDAFSVIRIKRNKFRYLNYFLALIKNGRRVDLIYAQDLISSGLPTVLANKILGKPLIIRLGGDFLWEKAINNSWTDVPLSKYYQQSKNIKEKIYLSIYRFVLAKADLIIFNSQWLLDIYKKEFKVINTVVVSNFIDTDKRAVSSIIGDEIIYAGRFIKLKNLINLTLAIKDIRTNKKFVFIGEGPVQSQLEKIAVCNLTFESTKSRKGLSERLRNCYFIIIPSLSEVSPNLVYEALALGRPVIVTRENGLPDNVKKHLIQIDPYSVADINSKIEFLLDQNNYRNYQEIINNISFQSNVMAVVDKYEDIFNKLIRRV